MNFLAVLKLIITLLPIIHSAVDQIEQLFPQGGYGAQKLEMVKTIIEKSISISELGGSAFGSIWPIISGVIGHIVSLKKATTETESPTIG